MAPGPILFLLSGRQFAEVSMLIAVVLVGPLAVVTHLIVVPNVVVAVIRVVDPVVMMFAGCAKYGTRKRGRKETGTQKTGFAAHLEMILPRSTFRRTYFLGIERRQFVARTGPGVAHERIALAHAFPTVAG
jgi:hypothetical protein